jgi:hypothetical protein
MSLNFPLLLVIAVAVCGALALFDLIFLAPRRRTAIGNYHGQVNQPDEAVVERLNKEPLLVEYGKSFFPVLAIVLVLDTFLGRQVNFQNIRGGYFQYRNVERGEPGGHGARQVQPAWGTLGPAVIFYHQKQGQAP